MESNHKKTLMNISKYATNLITQAIRKSFPLPDFNAIVTWNATGTSDLCCPSAMKIYNMNNKKENRNRKKEGALELSLAARLEMCCFFDSLCERIWLRVNACHADYVYV